MLSKVADKGSIEHRHSLLMTALTSFVQQDLADQLRNLEQVSGFTFSHVEGHGVQE